MLISPEAPCLPVWFTRSLIAATRFPYYLINDPLGCSDHFRSRGRGLEGERGIILGEEKCTPRAKRGGVVYGFSNGERVVLLPAATGMITRINCIVTKGEGRGRLAPIIVKSNLEPWLAARFLLLYLNFSFHSCAGIILRRDVEGGGEKIRRLNDSDRSLTRYGKKENIVIGWIRAGKVQRIEAVWKNLFSRNGFGRIRGGCRWFKMARSEWYIYIKFVENFLVRKL